MKMSPQHWMLLFIVGTLSCALCIVNGMPTTLIQVGKYVVHVAGLTCMVLFVFVLSLKVCGLPVPPILPVKDEDNFWE